MDLPTVVGQQTLYYIEVSLSFTYFLSLPLLKSYRKLLVMGSDSNVVKRIINYFSLFCNGIKMK